MNVACENWKMNKKLTFSSFYLYSLFSGFYFSSLFIIPSIMVGTKNFEPFPKPSQTIGASQLLLYLFPYFLQYFLLFCCVSSSFASMNSCWVLLILWSECEGEKIFFLCDGVLCVEAKGVSWKEVKHIQEEEWEEKKKWSQKKSYLKFV